MLKETRSDVRLVGLIEGIDRSDRGFGYREGNTKSGAAYRSIKFNIRTSPSNVVTVECFGMEREKVTFFKENDDEKRRIEVPWKNRFVQKEGYFTYPQSYDVVKELSEMNNGDVIGIRGRIQPNYYQNKQGEDIVSTRVQIDRFFTPDEKILEAISNDFSGEGEFKENNIISMDAIFEGKLDIAGSTYAVCWLIDYSGKAYRYTFKVDSPEKIKSLKKASKGEIVKLTSRLSYQNSFQPKSEQVLVETENGLEALDNNSEVEQRGYRGIEILGLKPLGVKFPMTELMTANVSAEKVAEIKEAKPASKPSPKTEEIIADEDDDDDIDLDALFDEIEKGIE